jgi:nitroreductase
MPETNNLDQIKQGVAAVPVEPLLLKRWSPRAFAETPVSIADLKIVFTAAAWAASSHNEQPWRFVVGRKGDATWQAIFDALMPLNQLWAKAAPVLFAACAKKTFSHNGAPNGMAEHDVGAASANIALQATALGMHAHGMAGFDRDVLRERLTIPQEFNAVVCWALGYRGDPNSLQDNFRQMESTARKRKSLEAFVFNKWDAAAF